MSRQVLSSLRHGQRCVRAGIERQPCGRPGSGGGTGRHGERRANPGQHVGPVPQAVTEVRPEGEVSAFVEAIPAINEKCRAAIQATLR